VVESDIDDEEELEKVDWTALILEMNDDYVKNVSPGHSRPIVFSFLFFKKKSSIPREKTKR
jgi:hypothetical protein